VCKVTVFKISGNSFCIKSLWEWFISSLVHQFIGFDGIKRHGFVLTGYENKIQFRQTNELMIQVN